MDSAESHMKQSMPPSIVMIIRFSSPWRFWGWVETSVPRSDFHQPSRFLPEPAKYWSEISFCSLSGSGGECWTGQLPVCVSVSCYCKKGQTSECFFNLSSWPPLPPRRPRGITRINYEGGGESDRSDPESFRSACVCVCWSRNNEQMLSRVKGCLPVWSRNSDWHIIKAPGSGPLVIIGF